MQLTDALFNWLQIEIVWKSRPSDVSARDTVEFFRTMLAEDHQVTDVHMHLQAEEYVITYQQQGEMHHLSFPVDLAEKLFKDITEEPRYNDDCF